MSQTQIRRSGCSKILFVAALILLAGLVYVSDNLCKIDYSRFPSRDAWQLPHETIRLLGVEGGDWVADIGAGRGYFTFFFADVVGKSGRVYAVEIDDSLVTYLQEQADEPGCSNVAVVKGHPADPQLPDGKIDLVFLCNTYHHIENRVEYFRRLKTDLTGKGRVAVVDLKAIPLAKHLDSWGHWVDPGSVREEMASAGFTLVESHDILPFNHFLVFRVQNIIDKNQPSG